MPLTTLVLKSWGASQTVIGANAAMPALSVIFFSPFIPRIARRVGMRRFLHACMAVLILSMLAFPLFPSIPAWFVIRLIYGAAATGLFVISEAWINELAYDDKRGTLIAIYSVIMSGGFVAGAVLLGIVGVEGFLPFVLGALLTAVGAVFLIPASESAVAQTESAPQRMLDYARLAPVSMIAVIVMGLLYTGVTALLPAYGVIQGLDYRAAAQSVAWLGTGEIFIPLAAGVLADRYRNDVIIVVVIAVVATALWVLPDVFATPIMRNPLLFLIGGAMVSLYSLGLTVLGRKFSGASLAMANATFVFAFGLGELAGPLIAGSAMDAWPPHGFSYSMATAATLAGLFIAVLAFRPGAGRNQHGRS
jgi:predicted MFS family arabinose efflux permease